MCSENPGSVSSSDAGISRRGFLGGLGAVAAVAGLSGGESTKRKTASGGAAAGGQALPKGRAVRVQPVLMYSLAQRQEKTSWRGYGGLSTESDVAAEIGRIKDELAKLVDGAEFPIEVLPLVSVRSEEEGKKVAGTDADAIVLYAASGGTEIVNAVAASKASMIMFIRHKSGPFYLWYEIAHWRFLRQNGDTFVVPSADVQDIVVDDYGQLLWRLRPLWTG